MLVAVTRNDIARGVSGEPSASPIALAIARAMGGAHVVANGFAIFAVAYADAYAGFTEYLVPGPVQDFMFRFDAGKEVGPLSFSLVPLE